MRLPLTRPGCCVPHGGRARGRSRAERRDWGGASSAALGGRVGYVLRRFPALSETFVLNELLALEKLGVPIHVFSLGPPRDPHFHEALAKLKAEIVYVPGPFELKALLRRHRRLARQFGRRYWKLALRVLLTSRPGLWWRFLQAGYVAAKARNRRISHLHAHFSSRATTAAMLASELIDVPYSFTAHANDIFREQNERVLIEKLRRAKFVATVSRWNVEYLRGLGGEDLRVELVYNGIDLARFTAPESRPGGCFTLLTVARLVEKKGLRYLIEAARILRDRGHEFRMVVVGKGRQRPRLVELIAQWELGDVVELIGARTQDEVREFYRRAHLMVLPCVVGGDGDKDGLPVSITEALACGLPVVSTPVTGVQEAVEDGRNGLLVPQRDAQALADAIESVMTDAELRARLEAGARPSILGRFDRDRTAAQLRDLLLGSAL